jgi:hypothetical protein
MVCLNVNGCNDLIILTFWSFIFIGYKLKEERNSNLFSLGQVPTLPSTKDMEVDLLISPEKH